MWISMLKYSDHARLKVTCVGVFLRCYCGGFLVSTVSSEDKNLCPATSADNWRVNRLPNHMFHNESERGDRYLITMQAKCLTEDLRDPETGQGRPTCVCVTWLCWRTLTKGDVAQH